MNNVYVIKSQYDTYYLEYSNQNEISWTTDLNQAQKFNESDFYQFIKDNKLNFNLKIINNYNVAVLYFNH